MEIYPGRALLIHISGRTALRKQTRETLYKTHRKLEEAAAGEERKRQPELPDT